MKKRFFPVLFIVSLLLFSCKGLTEALVADVDAIRSNISLTFEITNDGMTFNWTKPNHLDSHAERYFITDNSSSSLSSYYSLFCFRVPSSYQDSRYSDNVSIGKNISSVTIDEARIVCPVYFWTEIDDTLYNLGQFQPTVTTAVTQIKNQIKLNVDTTDINNLKFQWAIPNNIDINPFRFIISQDSNTKYESGHTFSCLVVNSAYLDSCFEDKVSIRRNCYTVQNNFKTYDVVASSENPQDYYLWIQVEDGSWWNLGQFVVRNAGGSQGGTSTTVTPDLTSIRSSIVLSYSYTNGGTVLTWTKPTGLSSFAKYFMISEDSSDICTTGGFTAKKVPSEYQDTSYGDEISIKASLNSAMLTWKVSTSQKLYLWVADSSENYYNLGQFTITSSDNITSIRNQITISGDLEETGYYDSDGLVAWGLPDTLTLNAMRFAVASDSSTYYSSSTPSNCKYVKSTYLDSAYSDNMSIRPNCYTNKSGYNIYGIYLQSPLTSDSYLWVQIETGYWYNLGKITYTASGSSQGSTTTLEQTLTSIRNSIDLTYSFTDGGTKLTWTKPTGLASITQYFMISENPDESATGSLSCKRIPSAYVDTTRNDETSIKASLNSVTLEWKVKTSQKLYLWIYSTSGTYYNLGQFTIPSSQITNIKSYIQIDCDIYDTGSFDPNGYLFWKIPASYTLNAMRFVVSSDSASSYSSDASFSCRRVESEYCESFYDDNVSIRPDCYLTVSNWNEYSIYLESQLTSGFYLWVQIEDGSWYNLGRITYL